MKILLASIGTRGDMEPFVAVGEKLKNKGHQVICVFPEQFRFMAEESQFEFRSLGPEFIRMLDSKDGKAALGGSTSGLRKMMAYIRLTKLSTQINKDLIARQCKIVNEEKPDRIIHNGKAIYPVIWGLKNPGKTIFLSPVPYIHFVKNHAHVAFNGNYGSYINKLTYRLANFGLVQTALISVKWLKLPERIKRKQIQKALFTNKALYTISTSLFQRPEYWNDNIKVLGYHERNKTVSWKPDPALLDFIQKHEKILFVTFGSMTNPNPQEKSKLITDIVERNNIPAIINTAEGGLAIPDNYNSDLVCFVSQIPYDWIFPKVYAVIHHGGSGSTHMSLKYGCATMIIPHIIDQFVWNKKVYELGAGPLGLKIDQLRTEPLEKRILDLWTNKSYKQKALQISQQMQSENFTEELCGFIVS
ncbi:glycosyltransferase family 1 protein [Labilibacter sediminis]|nr:glycosyltransferase family 1 protein [Labilibacter sediminis]